MTRDDVIRLAREAGMGDCLGSWCQECGFTDNMLERFAALVIKAHTQQVINDPAEIRRVFEIDEADYPPADSGFAKL